MSEFTAPGVYVQEALTPTPVIAAASTTTAAFVGRTRRGPVYGITDSLMPQPLTSVADFQRIYGGFHAIGATPNYLALAVRAYFDNGGTKLYVSRVAELPDPSTEPPETADVTVDTGVADAGGRTGRAKSALVVASTDPTCRMDFVARFPGEAGNATLVVTQVATPASQATIDGAPLGSMLRLVPSSPAPPNSTAPTVAPTPPTLATKRQAVPISPTLAKRVTIGNTAAHIAQASQGAALADANASYFVKAADGWRDASNAPLDPGALSASIAAGNGAALLTLTVTITDGDGIGPTAFAGLAFDARHPQWLGAVLCAHPANAADAAANLVEARIGRNLDAFALRSGLFANGDSKTITLHDGADGPAPTLAAYQRALSAFEQLSDISTVAAPDAAAFPDILANVNGVLVANAELPGALRMAVLDTAAGLSPAQAQSAKGTIDSSYAAMYYPWVVVNDPTATASTPPTPATIAIPPSGFVAGIFASHDRTLGVAKAPGNAALLGGVRLERVLTDPESATLSPAGINALRSFVGRGLQLWGARTTSSDQEWQYINVRRYVSYLERSIDAGTQWTVSEPNAAPLWSKLATTVSNFLFSEFKAGALQGTTPTQAFLVRCDASTMTQNDIDNGRLICLVGIAPLQPAQFVIVRIEKMTSTTP